MLKKEQLVYQEFDVIDYQDCFVVKGEFEDIDDFAKAYFLSQPSWLSLISMGMFSKIGIEKAIKLSKFEENTCVGSWKIYVRDEKEIVFGDDMGFMEYRFFMMWVDTETIGVGTVVQFKGKFGKYYFDLVKLMHKNFVKKSLNSIDRVKEIYETDKI